VIQTAEDPPSAGSNCFAAMGSTAKSKNAPRKIVMP
jgi:hypothetical protein